MTGWLQPKACPLHRLPFSGFLGLSLLFFILILWLLILFPTHPTPTTGDSSLGRCTADTTSWKPRTAHMKDAEPGLRFLYALIPSQPPHPFFCFPYHYTGDCFQGSSMYRGCRHWTCWIWVFQLWWNHGYQPLTLFSVSFNNAWDKQWQTGFMYKLYTNGFSKQPIADLHVSSHLVLASESVFTHINPLQ